jgi:HK97 family phage major capsid protein
LAAYVPQISLQLFEDAPDLVAQMLQDAFMRSFAVALDAAALTGAGGANEPLGLSNNSSVQQTSISGGQITADELSAGVAKVKWRNYVPSAIIYSPDAESELAVKKASTGGEYLGFPAGVAELPKYVTSSASNNAYVGDFNRMMFFIRTGLNLEFSRTGDGTAWKGLAVSLRGYMRATVVTGHPGAFQILTGYTS